jgi:hypothetical protein
MAQSFLSAVPFAAPDTMPWNWNPGQTFLTAYYDAQAEKRAQQEFQAAQEMDQILFPIKQQQAQLALEKMNLEMERTRGEIDRQRILTRQMTDVQRNVNQGFNSGLSGGAATNAPQTPAQPRFRPFGTSAPKTSQEEMVTI